MLAGDALERQQGLPGLDCFNPRPPLLAGDAHVLRQHQCGLRGFNPRPPLLAGDAEGGIDATPAQVFQSAPAIAGGRCPDPAARCQPTSGFNPRPPLLAGDAIVFPAIDIVRFVSIRARHCWRAMPWFFSGFNCWYGFNPRPPLLAGDAVVIFLVAVNTTVSIRARHCWRAMPPAPTTSTSTVPGFNPRPPLLAGDAIRSSDDPGVQFRFQSAPAIAGGRCHFRTFQRVKETVFQSAPAIAGGRCLMNFKRHGRHVRFNPRPPLLAGDA